MIIITVLALVGVLRILGLLQFEINFDLVGAVATYVLAWTKIIQKWQ